MMKAMRRLPLQHAHNVRDLGGYPLDEMHMTTWNRIYRSDDLTLLDETEWKLLKERGITCILDLRTSMEQKMATYPCELYGIHHVSLPFLKEEKQPDMDLDQAAMKKFMESMKLDYVAIFKDAAPYIKLALEEIASTLQKKENVLFHCTAGKDRTGILACILLSLCGVSDEDILADYQVSATYGAKKLIQRMGNEGWNHPSLKALFESRVDMMEPLLAYVHKTSCEDCLKDIGVKEETIQKIRDEFIQRII